MTRRLPLIDMARSAALLGMVAFHLAYDLQIFGLLPPGTAGSGWFWYHARAVAGSFLALAGLSLWLAHGAGVNWPGFWRRWLRLAAAAGLVTAATWLALPEAYVFFGILHAIATFSLVGIVLIRLPAPLLLAMAAGLVWGAYNLAGPAFDVPALRFLGLSTEFSHTIDFEPVFPWLAPFLAGMALGRIGSGLGIWDGLRGWPKGGLAQALAWPGRHSLAIYLIHQPILMGLIWSWLQLR